MVKLTLFAYWVLSRRAARNAQPATATATAAIIEYQMLRMLVWGRRYDLLGWVVLCELNRRIDRLAKENAIIAGPAFSVMGAAPRRSRWRPR